VGLSYKTDDERNFSFGAGLRAKELINVDDGTRGRKLTANLTWNIGAFYDRDNSLLASILFSGLNDYKLHINIYPGIIHIGKFSPGLFCAFGEQGKFVSGLNLSYVPVGIAGGVSE
jgi:hypothetical protein